MAEFPTYAALVSPEPLSVEHVQKQLGSDEALVLFLDTLDLKPTPEETFIWVITKNDVRWVRSELGTPAAIAAHTRQSALSPKAFDASFSARLDALGKAHDLLTRSQWSGTTLQDAVDVALEPFLGNARGGRLSASGPAVWLAPNIGVTLTLALHELATNATKYGAWSDESGQVMLTWSVDATAARNSLQLHWQERGGPPVTAPARKGFGSMLLERVLAYDSSRRGHSVDRVSNERAPGTRPRTWPRACIEKRFRQP